MNLNRLQLKPVGGLVNIGEVGDSRTGGIFIRDTACFHCYSMNCDLKFSASQWKYAVSRMKMPAVRESATFLYELTKHCRRSLILYNCTCLCVGGDEFIPSF